MRLQNMQKVGGYEYRVVLDSEKRIANYVERSKGVFYDYILCEHRCLKCMKPVIWITWTNNGRRAKSTCDCGQEQTLEYLVCFDRTADAF